MKVETGTDVKLSLDFGKLVIKNFFKVKRELIESIQKFNLNLITFESNDNMDIELEALRANESSTIGDISRTLEVRKRSCEELFNTDSLSKRIKK